MSAIGDNVAKPLTNYPCWHCHENPFTVPHWYAVYTCSHQERKAAEQIAHKEIVCFLPTQESERVWKNGQRVLAQSPLFRGYLFVNIPLSEKIRVLQTPGVVRFVGTGGIPELIPEEQIYAVLTLVEAKLDFGPAAYLRTGQRVEVRCGPLQGVQGILQRRRGKCRLVLSVDLIRQSVALEIDAHWVQPVF